MPKNLKKILKKFQHSKIYIIKSPSTESFYIGSTVTSLKTRFDKHKSAFRVYEKTLLDIQNGSLIGSGKRCTSFEILKYEDAFIEKIELYKCNCREELYQRESEIIKEYKDKNDKIVNKRK